MKPVKKRKTVTAKLEWVNPNHHVEMMALKVKAEARVKELEAQLEKVNEELDECERTENYNPSYETLCEAVGREH